MDTSLLESIGLTKSEINVYMALLELGTATTGPIVEKSGAASSKIYEILDRLMQKGLVSSVIEEGIKHFEAASPERILDYLQEKEQKLQEQKQSIKNLIPELLLKKTLAKYKTEATVFRGMKGLETAFKDTLQVLKKGDTMYVYVVGELDVRMSDYFKKQYQFREKIGIKTKTIYSDEGRQWYERERKGMRLAEGKVIPNAMASPATVNIYKDNVIIRIGDSKNVIAIRIKNKDLADSFYDQFLLLWNQDVLVYKGFEPVTERFRSMLDELESGDEYQVIGATYGHLGEQLSDWFRNYHKERVKKGIKARLLGDPDYKKDILEEFIHGGDPTGKISEVRSLPKALSGIPMQINLYKGNKVIFFMFEKDMRCFEISSEALYKNFRAYFEALWNT
ncbi:hypothetical protein C4573_06130 [Candidatus Woesearchaeota archaeon]|nr:MAG: hypothetical protein C4573_06130 [Candidatus Woesearchaeota archaeon]